MCGFCGCEPINSSTHSHHHGHHPDYRVIEIEKNILSENQHHADHNRQFFKKKNIFAFNFVSSPGSGKTTLLIETILSLRDKKKIYVIEGDQQTDLDAKRIAQTGVPVLQLNTGKMCHLDAHLIGHAVEDLKLETNSILFIENVGNLVCPALFDLGEKCKIVILSVTEGDDKPLKYPHMFHESTLMIINKIDLLPYVNFDIEKCIAYAKQVNPNIVVLQTSATTRAGIDQWCEWLSSVSNNS